MPIIISGVQYSGKWNLQAQAQADAAATWPKPHPPYGLYVWGHNNTGQLGLDDTVDRSSPVILGSENWSAASRAVFGGGLSSGAIRADGTIWVMGANNNYQLGTGNSTNYSSPVQIGSLTTWLKAAAGAYHTAAIKTDGTLWTWGRGALGQLGTGATASKSNPIQVGGLTTWLQVASGYASTMGITTDGKLYAWGYNAQGNLGLGNTTNYSSPVQVGALTTWASVGCAQVTTWAIKTDGTLWGWGYNNVGQVGNGNTTSMSSPVQIGALTTWSQVGGTASSAIALKTDGTLWMWGDDTYGQLGQGTVNITKSSPVQVGALTTWAKVGTTNYSVHVIKTDGTLWSWGRNQYGQIGVGTQSGSVFYSSPVQVGALTTWAQVRNDCEGAAVLSIKTPN